MWEQSLPRRTSALSTFYQVPKYIFNPIAESGIVSGSVLLPYDESFELTTQVRNSGITDITTNTSVDNVTDLNWWSEKKDKFDWIIAVTQGTKEITSWVTECGIQTASKGICILDRLTFLEPTRTRQDFLKEAALENIKILSPRPSFRDDKKSLKDSVTSAWFVFRRQGSALIKTNVDFEVGWHRPKNLKL
jgi:hypothetical protein